MICTHWQRMTHLTSWLFLTPDKYPLLLIPRGSGPFDLKNFNSPSSPLSLCPFSCAAISIGVRHASTLWLIWLSLSSLSVSFFLCGSSNPLSLVFYFLNLPYFASAIAFTCTHPNLFFVYVNVDLFHFRTIQSHPGNFPHCPLYPICISLFLLLPTHSHLFNMWFFPLHVTLSALIGHLLYNSSHPSHRSLNGLSPTTISPCSHSSFPSPLSLSR